MRVKLLARGKYDVVAVMDADECPAEQFLLEGEGQTEAARSGLLLMICVVAERGLGDIPHAWSHQADPKGEIYELIKGPLRLFYFKGEGRQIAVCALGSRKTGKKADKSSINAAATCRKEYFDAVHSGTLEMMNGEAE